MKKIKLTQGENAIVDDEDYPYLNRFTWQKMLNCDRAVRTINVNGQHICIPMECLLTTNKKGYNFFHKNRNGLDNRKENIGLVKASVTVHASQKRKTHNGKPCSSKYKGVSKMKSRPGWWNTRLYKDGKRYFCKNFRYEKDAAKAYNEKARELYGKLAYQNKI